MTATATAVRAETRSTITLKGSTDLVHEFFDYSVNSILYQRGVYPPENFSRAQKYGLTLLLSTDAEVTGYIRNVLAQVTVFLQFLKTSLIGLQKSTIVCSKIFFVDLYANINNYITFENLIFKNTIPY